MTPVRQMGTFVMLGGRATFTGKEIPARTKGRECAKTRGVKMDGSKNLAKFEHF
jgi:hypothetical protein